MRVDREAPHPGRRLSGGLRRATTEDVSRLSRLAAWASRHRRLLTAVQLVVLAAFFISLGWALRGTVHSAVHDLDHANLVYFALGCAALATIRFRRFAYLVTDILVLALVAVIGMRVTGHHLDRTAVKAIEAHSASAWTHVAAWATSTAEQARR